MNLISYKAPSENSLELLYLLPSPTRPRKLKITLINTPNTRQLATAHVTRSDAQTSASEQEEDLAPEVGEILDWYITANDPQGLVSSILQYCYSLK